MYGHKNPTNTRFGLRSLTVPAQGVPKSALFSVQRSDIHQLGRRVRHSKFTDTKFEIVSRDYRFLLREDTNTWLVSIM